MRKLLKFLVLTFSFLIFYNVAKAQDTPIYRKKVTPASKTTTPEVKSNSNSPSNNALKKQKNNDAVAECSWVRVCEPNRNKLTLKIKSSKPGACCRFYSGELAYSYVARDAQVFRERNTSNTCQFEDGQTFVLDAKDTVAPAKYVKPLSKLVNNNGKKEILVATDNGMRMTKQLAAQLCEARGMKLISNKIAEYEKDSRRESCVDNCALYPHFYWTPSGSIYVRSCCDNRKYEKAEPSEYKWVRCGY